MTDKRGQAIIKAKNIKIIEKLIKAQEKKVLSLRTDLLACIAIPVIILTFILLLGLWGFTWSIILTLNFISISIIMYFKEKNDFKAASKALNYLQVIHKNMVDEQDKVQNIDEKLTLELNVKKYRLEKLKELLLVEYFYRDYKKIKDNYDNNTLAQYLQVKGINIEDINFIYNLINSSKIKKLVRKKS